MKKKNVKNIRGSIFKKILEKVSDSTALDITFSFLKREPLGLAHEGYLQKKAYLEEVRLRRALKIMEDRKMMSVREEGNRLIIKLTSKGKIEVLKIAVSSKKKKHKKKNVTLVIFDIPEVARSARYTLRYFLKEANFVQKQQSAWKSEFDVTDEISELIKYLKIEKWVSVYTASEK